MTPGLSLIDPEYDRHSTPEDGSLRHLLICTTPRTGGHAVCSIFAALGWGVPMEYFNPDFMIPLQERWLNQRIQSYTLAKERLGPYAQALLNNRTIHCLFSVKVFPDQHRLYQEAFGNREPHGFIRLIRNDKVAQAISFAVTLSTRRAFRNESQMRFLPRVGELNEDKMIQIMNWIHKNEAYWDTYLDQIEAKRCVNIIWEEVIVDPITTFAKIADQLYLPFSSEKATLSKVPDDIDSALKVQLTSRFGARLSQLSRELYGHQL